MGVIADNVQLTREALDIKGFQEWFEPVYGPFFKHQPTLTPRVHTPLWEKTAGILQDMRDDAAAQYASGFAERTQMGFEAWHGPPGFVEEQVHPVREAVPIEDNKGDLLNESA